MTAPISLVVARAKNGVIGNKGAIPWRIPEDMRRFKALTLGKPIIMGRKTWESLPKKPLPGRTNIIVTRDPRFQAEGAIAVHTIDDAIVTAQREDPAEIAVIGGAEIYAAALPLASIIHLTEVEGDFAGDTSIPPFDPRQWQETAREEHATADRLQYAFVTLRRS